MPEDEPKSPVPGGEPLILPRRHAAPSRDSAAKAERESELAELADSFKALSERLTGGAGPAAEPPSESAQRASRRWKRTHEPELENVSRPQKAVSAPGAPARTVPSRGKPRKRPAARKNMLPVWIAGQAFCLGLLAVGYFVGQLGNSAPAPAANGKAIAAPAISSTPAPPLHTVSERAFEAVNQAMASARNGDSAAARQILEDAQRQELAIPGIDYRLALLALQRTDMKEAKLRLDCAMAADQELSACCYVRSMLAGAIGDYNRAAQESAHAAYADPFSARYIFFWAECLRRNGRSQQAIDRFEEALTRPATPTDRDFIAFKLRLAKIEAGRATEFTPELAKRLGAEPVDPLWLLTAAALALEAGDPSGAATQLQKATRLMPAADFDIDVRDYLLISHSTEKEVAPYFNRTAQPASPSPNVAAITVDPSSWTLESADPGAWPSAAHAR